jgi:hypothetical protein
LGRLAPDEPAGLKRLLHERLAAFRDGLATDYLLETREEMRAGDIPEGWRADYEAGLARLRRLLSLDRDNPVLLTALLEICGDWFLDLYNTQEVEQMRAEADRYGPFAAQLARVGLKPGEGWSGELAARAALAEFYKFRGYLAESPDRKIALYREALAFNPANDNVRRLLAELEGPP